MLTTQDLLDLYNILLDKYSSPTQIDSEILKNLNMATYEYLNRLVPDNQGGIVNFEFDTNVVANLQPLIVPLTLNMNGSGLLTEAVIETALQGESGDATAKVFRVMSVGITTGGKKYPVKYTFQNSKYVDERNFFKRPTATNPKYTMLAEGLEFYPTNTGDPLTVTVIKTPAALALSPLQNPELPDYVMYNIISIALQIGGVQVRDEELIADIRNTSLQINK